MCLIVLLMYLHWADFLAVSSTLQELLRLESSIAGSLEAFEAEVSARQALLAELEEQRQVQKQLDEVLTWVRDLQVAWLEAGKGSFSESFRDLMESVHKLEEAVREIYQKAPHWTQPKYVSVYTLMTYIYKKYQYGRDPSALWIFITLCS